MAYLDDVLIFVKVAQFEEHQPGSPLVGYADLHGEPGGYRCWIMNLGVSLLRRTTRRVTLTAQGREYFNQCREPLTLLEEAERVLTRAQKRPEGLLRITVPVILKSRTFFLISCPRS